MDDQIGGVHLVVLAVILNKCKFFDRIYVFPTQNTLLKWVKNASGLKRCRRTLNYVLLRLEKKGLIRRTQRHYNDKKLGHVFRSTLYGITKKGLRKLKWIGVPAFEIVQAITKAVRGRPKKYPRPANRGQRKGNMSQIKGMMTNILGDLKPK